MDQVEALGLEFEGGEAVVRSGETVAGATRFTEGAGRHGSFTDD
jgi:enoyl-CoA hydratase